MRFNLRQWIIIEALVLGNGLIIAMFAVSFLGDKLGGLKAAQQAAATQVLEIIYPTPAPTETPQPEEAKAIVPTETETAPEAILSWLFPPTNTPTSVVPALSATPEPTATPEVRDEVLLDVKGKPQSLPLSCESRSAVDWAGYFGYEIDEVEFFSRLPLSDNPEVGFVGDVNGQWGQVPPNAYGVHAEPVAALLREYGVNAQAVRNFSWDQAKAELAAGRPLVVWVIGHVWSGGKQIEYTSQDGATTIVAPYEHTVMLIGYDSENAIISDEGKVYPKPIDAFLKSWGVLENQAVIAGQ